MTVYLVGADRGDPQLLTLRAAGMLARAQVVVHDRLVSPEVLVGVLVTLRGLAHGVTIATGATKRGAHVVFRALANPDVTPVVLMGVQHRVEIAAELQVAGLSYETPVAIIEWASTPRQRTVRCWLDELVHVAVSSSAVLVIGAVVSLELNDALDSSLALGA